MTICSLIIAHQHQTSRNSLCFRFRVMLTNGQRLQVLILSFRCPHSLYNAVDGQHSPRKPRCGAGRLSTTPDTKNHLKRLLCLCWAQSVDLRDPWIVLRNLWIPSSRRNPWIVQRMLARCMDFAYDAIHLTMVIPRWR